MDRLADARVLSGGAMILAFVVLVPGALLYLSRPDGGSSLARLGVERGCIMAAVVLVAIGLLLLGESLTRPAARSWALIGAWLYAFGAVLILTNEALGLSRAGPAYTLEVVYVLLALLGQASVGVGIVLSGTLPPLLGWVTVAWNLFWLIILPLTTPSEMYFPVLHHLMPLAIGTAMTLDSGGGRP